MKEVCTWERLNTKIHDDDDAVLKMSAHLFTWIDPVFFPSSKFM